MYFIINYTVLLLLLKCCHVLVLIQTIPVEELIKGDFKSNFEFLKWFRSLYMANVKSKEYEPVTARDRHEISPLLASPQLCK